MAQPQPNALDTEPIWTALLALLRAQASGFVTIGRLHVRPPTLTSDLQPALFVVQARETYAQRPVIGAPARVTLAGFLILYFQAPLSLEEAIGAETVVGATQLNALLHSVRLALAPDDVVNGRLTLGGLVHHCWIEGDVDMDPGIYTQQGAALVPIRILVP